MNFYIHYICYLNFLLPEINNPPEVISLPGDNLKYCNLNLTHIFPIIISADMILNFICTDKLKICIVHDCFCLSYCYITFHTYFTRANSYHYCSLFLCYNLSFRIYCCYPRITWFISYFLCTGYWKNLIL